MTNVEQETRQAIVSLARHSTKLKGICSTVATRINQPAYVEGTITASETLLITSFGGTESISPPSAYRSVWRKHHTAPIEPYKAAKGRMEMETSRINMLDFGTGGLDRQVAARPAISNP